LLKTVTNDAIALVGALVHPKQVRKERSDHGVPANVLCSGYVRTPHADRQIPAQADKLGISKEAVIREIIPRTPWMAGSSRCRTRASRTALASSHRPACRLAF